MERSKVLAALIKEAGYSNRAFAEKIGLPPTTLQSILTRGAGKASVDNIIKICRALGITVDDMERLAAENKNDSDIETIAAHHDGDVWTEEELKEIEKFKEFVKSKKKQPPSM